MDTKNVIAAISLSAAVIVLYALFFPPSPTQKSQDLSEKNKIEQNSDMPTLEQKKKVVKISRNEAINQNDRISFENKDISHFVPALSLGDKVVDTSGAGDAFNGSFAAALCEDKDIKDAIVFANTFAGISTTRIGTANSMPSREEIDKLI